VVDNANVPIRLNSRTMLVKFELLFAFALDLRLSSSFLHLHLALVIQATARIFVFDLLTLELSCFSAFFVLIVLIRGARFLFGVIQSAIFLAFLFLLFVRFFLHFLSSYLDSLLIRCVSRASVKAFFLLFIPYAVVLTLLLVFYVRAILFRSRRWRIRWRRRLLLFDLACVGDIFAIGLLLALFLGILAALIGYWGWRRGLRGRLGLTLFTVLVIFAFLISVLVLERLAGLRVGVVPRTALRRYAALTIRPMAYRVVFAGSLVLYAFAEPGSGCGPFRR